MLRWLRARKNFGGEQKGRCTAAVKEMRVQSRVSAAGRRSDQRGRSFVSLRRTGTSVGGRRRTTSPKRASCRARTAPSLARPAWQRFCTVCVQIEQCSEQSGAQYQVATNAIRLTDSILVGLTGEVGVTTEITNLPCGTVQIRVL